MRTTTSICECCGQEIYVVSPGSALVKHERMAVYKSLCRFVILTLILNILVLQQTKFAIADLTVIPLWNATTNQTGAMHCQLSSGNYQAGVTILSENSIQTCRVQLISTNGTAALIQKPYGVSMYVERQANVLDCQKRYVSVTTTEPCVFVSLHPTLKLFLQVYDYTESGIHIGDVPANKSVPTCLQVTVDEEQHASRVSQTKYCQTQEFNHLISCNLSPDYTCSFKFPANCNATFLERHVELQCQNQHSNQEAFIEYPAGIITLNLSKSNAVDILGNAFTTLPKLKQLLLDQNFLSRLNFQVFKNLTSLNRLSLIENNLNSLSADVFHSLTNLTELFLSSNKLTTLPQGLFNGLYVLKILDMSRNEIKHLPENIFGDLVDLNVLDMGRNKFETVPNDLFISLRSLTSLFLDDNYLKVLKTGVFSGLRNLEYLTLKGNQLNISDKTTLDMTSVNELARNLFWGLNNILTLDLGVNNLAIVPRLLFTGLTNLRYLYLGWNQISSLDESLFFETSGLNELHLTGNHLEELSVNLFRGLKNLTKLYLNANKITSLHENLLNETNKITYLTFQDNSLTQLPTKLFWSLRNLEYLRLTFNQIVLVQDDLFRYNYNLIYVSLRNNKLKRLPDTLFRGLSKLMILSLGDNQIEYVNFETFYGLNNLRVLYLSDNRLKICDLGSLQDLRVLILLRNKLKNIPNIYYFKKLIFIDLKDNELTDINTGTFSSLTKQTELVVSQHEICECYVSSDIQCSAANDRSPFLTCDRLLSDRILVVVMWLIGLNAVGGNIFVLCQRGKQADKNKVQTFLLNNLAISDLLMGVYMLLIACADIYFGEYFPMQAETWRSGITCRIAGTISILSSEASVFFVTLISIDRFINIRNPFSRFILRKKSSTVVVLLLWITALALGIVPSSLAGINDRFYDNSHVCIGLPLSKLHAYETVVIPKWIEICGEDNLCYSKQAVESKYLGEFHGMVFASVMFLGLNFICYLVILMCYIEIVRAYFTSSKSAGLQSEMKKQIRLTGNVTAIVLTDFACWFPIIILGILVQAGVLTLPPSVFAWCVTFVLPINSAINPYLYTIAAIASKYCQRAPTQASKSQNTRESELQVVSSAPIQPLSNDTT